MDRTRDDISKDFLYFELYYAPGEKCYFVNLRWQIENCPNRFDSVKYGKTLKKKTLVKSKKISKKDTYDYIKKLEDYPREPSKDEEFINSLCLEVIKAMNDDKMKKECKIITNAII